MTNNNPKMKSLIDLMWSIEDDSVETNGISDPHIIVNCGGDDPSPACCCEPPHVIKE